MDISFSEFEKKIIRRLVNVTDIKERVFFNYIYDDADYMAIEWDEHYTQVTIYLKGTQPDELKTWDFLCEILFLIKKLETYDFIGIYNINKNNRAIFNKKYKKGRDIKKEEDLGVEGVFFDDENYFEYKKNEDGSSRIGSYMGPKVIFNSDMGKYLEKYAYSAFYISQSLKDLVNNNFHTSEEIRHKNTMCISIAAIILSFLIGLAGLFKCTDPQIISPLNSISKKSSDISSKIDSINVNLKTQEKHSLKINGRTKI